MLIEIHMIQNHSPANLNRDDLGAPKTCYFGGALRSRISSQCIKRSIRLSPEFKGLLGGIRTRRLAEIIQGKIDDAGALKKAKDVLSKCGIAHKEGKGSDMLVFTTWEAVDKMVAILQEGKDKDSKELAERFASAIENLTYSPDMALCGRMLETKSDLLKNTQVEAALQVAHAISTHEARPEIDYFVAVDDVPGADAGAGMIGESMYSSACFYKYFSINWELLLKNLNGNSDLAAHTVGAFILAAAKTNPSGKQNSFAAHNYPDGILVEIKNSPISYANAFAKPVTILEDADIVACSIGQLANYAVDLKVGYSSPSTSTKAFWFSPNLRYELNPNKGSLEQENSTTIDSLVSSILKYMGYDWDSVKQSQVQES